MEQGPKARCLQALSYDWLLEDELRRKLNIARIAVGAGNLAEVRTICKGCIRSCEVGMVESVERFKLKLQVVTLFPADVSVFEDREIRIGKARVAYIRQRARCVANDKLVWECKGRCVEPLTICLMRELRTLEHLIWALTSSKETSLIRRERTKHYGGTGVPVDNSIHLEPAEQHVANSVQR